MKSAKKLTRRVLKCYSLHPKCSINHKKGLLKWKNTQSVALKGDVMKEYTHVVALPAV
ncbi:hypothetical protein [Chondrinema litorale]|uniref:hypothetical protein n=1 Tax=Chondrinema litorale TaxID=2994555 RepID=UPI002542B06C|nr:hypothetical protein [Chondrinema litorale]UZS00122.1 hypothetical protein OQ292_39890 [Chondrinema litorale]